MKKKIILGGIGVGIVLVTIGIYFVRNITEKDSPQKENNNNQLIKIVDVDKVVATPSHYKGFLGVEGTVIRIDESQNLFLLGCEDACIFMPVKYTGQMPKSKSVIIVYGEIKKQEDGGYVFQGKEVKTR